MIGILAGMGPKSTAPFIDLIVEQCQKIYGARYDIDFPPMMIHCLPAPFYLDRPIDHELLKQVIIAGLEKLVATGVDFIAMPCNTAHLYFDDLAAAIPIPLLNIIDETVATIPPHLHRLALLATPPTVTAGIYQPHIVAAGFELYQSPTLQLQVNKLLTTIKQGEALPVLVTAWQTLCLSLKEVGVEGVIVACTDLNAVSDKVTAPLPIIDSALALAQATVREYCRRQQPENGKRDRV